MALKSYALTTVDRVREFMGKSSFTAAQSSVVESLINMVTERIESTVGLRFKQTAYVGEIHDGTDTDILILKNRPVISSETITLYYRDAGGNENSWDEIDSEDYFIDYDAGVLYKPSGGTFAPIRKGYKVDYTAGYNFNNTTTFLSDTKAGDIEFITWKIVSSLYQERSGGRPVTAERIGDYSVQFAKSIYGDEDIMYVLDQYMGSGVTSYLSPYKY